MIAPKSISSELEVFLISDFSIKKLWTEKSKVLP
jgi:hypothetical protein